MRFDECDEQVRALCLKWIARLELPDSALQVTCSRRRFESWLGRRVDARIGGGYAFDKSARRHLVLINLSRIDQTQPRAVEIVVCEELLHMRHRIDGDLRRHHKHGYDRIAMQVAQLTGVTMDEVRSALLPTHHRPYKYRYECPTCRRSVLRRKRGLWSCGTCAPTFSRHHVLRLVEELDHSAVSLPEPPR